MVLIGEGWFIFSFRFMLPRNSIVPPSPAADVDAFKWADQKKAWSTYMDAMGPEAAYNALKKQYEKQMFMVQHSAVHLLGALLYEKFGLKGIRFCDNSFAFGCYHSFFASASSHEGAGMLAALDKECNNLKDRVDTFTCQHGIGHSLLAHGQMSHKELLDALTVCDTLSHVEPISGCKSGVFMEYNFQSMASIERPGTTALRSFNAQDPYAPCSKLPAAFTQGCYFAETQWWDNVLGHDYVRMGKLCADITDEKLQSTCFSGVGNVAAEHANYDIAAVEGLCNKMPAQKGVADCLISASWTFSNDSRLRAQAPDVCRNASIDIQKRCAPKQ